MKNIIIVQPNKYLDIRQDKFIKSFVEKGYFVNILYDVENEAGVTKELYTDIESRIKFFRVGTKLPANIPFNIVRNCRINKLIGEIKPEILICRDILMSGFINNNHDYESIIDICDNFPEVLELLMKKPINILAKFVANYVEKNALLKFKKVTFVSDSSAEYILKKHNLRNIDFEVLENIPYSRSIELNGIEKSKDLVYIGTINTKIRDIDNVIKAIEECNRLGKKVTFDIYYFKKQINIINYYRDMISRKGLSKNIRFFEAVPIEELPRILSKYKYGIVPHCRNKATDYTIPNKLYDYLQLGMSVITSDNPSLVEFCNKHEVTRYYKGEDYKSLANEIMTILSKDCEYVNYKGAQLINDTLNWDRCFNDAYEWMVI